MQLRYGWRLRSTILKAGHHGSKHSSTEDFLKKVRPEIMILMRSMMQKNKTIKSKKTMKQNKMRINKPMKKICLITGMIDKKSC